jgi:hypothetical protein
MGRDGEDLRWWEERLREDEMTRGRMRWGADEKHGSCMMVDEDISLVRYSCGK